jgi:outer membrane protein assembly factor BamB
MKELRALLALYICASVAMAGDWPQWLGPRRDGSSDEIVKPWQTPLKELWKQTIDEGNSSPIIAGDRVYLHTRVGKKDEEALTAYDANTGKQLWRTVYARSKYENFFGGGPRATPSVSGNKLYSYGVTGILTCSDVESGKQIWQVDCLKKYKTDNLFFGASCSPLIVDDLILVNVGGKGNSVVAFNKDSGEERWKALDDKASYSSPILLTQAGRQAVVFLTASKLVALAPQDGTILWQHPLVDALFESSTTPALCGDILFGSSITFGGVGLKLTEMDGKPAVKQLWQKPELNCYFSTPVSVGKEHLYVVTGTKPAFTKILNKATLRCVEAQTGKELWNRDKVGVYHASLLRTGDSKLLLLEEEGRLVLLQPDPQSYKELASSRVCGKTWAHPALAGGRLYIRDDAKTLRCIELPQ